MKKEKESKTKYFKGVTERNQEAIQSLETRIKERETLERNIDMFFVWFYIPVLLFPLIISSLKNKTPFNQILSTSLILVLLSYSFISGRLGKIFFEKLQINKILKGEEVSDNVLTFSSTIAITVYLFYSIKLESSLEFDVLFIFLLSFGIMLFLPATILVTVQYSKHLTNFIPTSEESVNNVIFDLILSGLLCIAMYSYPFLT